LLPISDTRNSLDQLMPRRNSKLQELSTRESRFPKLKTHREATGIKLKAE
jgi:hypothetical protein